MLKLAPEWTMDVERGPDWLFVRLHGPDDGEAEGSNLANQLWSLMEQHFTYRLVLELDDVTVLRSCLLGQLVVLCKRIYAHGGMLRLAGLSEENLLTLRLCRLDGNFPHYTTRAAAVMGQVPAKPR